MAKFFLTGAAGEVGRTLTTHLLDQSHEVYGMVRRASEVQRKGYVEVVSPVEDWRLLEDELPTEVDVFVHLAWAGSAGPDRSNAALQLNNVLVAQEAVRMARALNADRFVGVGTVTEGATALPLDASHAPPQAYLYGAAKLAAADFTRYTAAEENIDHLWLRLGNTYLPPLGDQPRFLGMVLRTLAAGDRLALAGGNQPYDFVHLNDAVRAIELAGLRGKAGKTYYVGSGHPRPLRAYVEELASKMDSHSSLVFGEAEHYLPTDAYSTEELHADTGYESTIAFEEAAEELVSEFRA